jgi:phosphatidylinositol-3,4,5-trisphosphate 3-phosphatase/dual-specificity protein phosphatase PTEN
VSFRDYVLTLSCLSTAVRIAGKGRSGTMACSYLISLPKLPTPPQDSRNISIAKHKGKNGADIHTQSSAPRAISPVRAQDSQAPSSPSASKSNEYNPSAWRSKIEAALALHSSQRMKPKYVSAGPLAVSVNTVSSANHANGQAAAGPTGRTDVKRPRSLALGLVPGGTVSGVPEGTSVAGASPNATTAPSAQEGHASLDTSSQAPSAGSDHHPDEGDEEESHSALSLAGRVGVSIASQRRWMGYWARVLAQRSRGSASRQIDPHPTHQYPARSRDVRRGSRRCLSSSSLWQA